jgi:hypothetical protein
MRAVILAPDDTVVEVVETEPICGEDFCDQCGDCLACQGEGPCPHAGGVEGDTHDWYVYAKDAPAWRASHGDGGQLAADPQTPSSEGGTPR